MPRRHRLIAAAAAAVLVLSACQSSATPFGSPPGSPPLVPPDPGDATAYQPPPGSYDVRLTGTVSGIAFARDARVTVGTTMDAVATHNGVNPFEVCLRSGFPAGAPEPGAIWFGSNGGCFGSPQRIDLVSAQWDGTTFTASPDPSLSQLQVNGWTARGGATACFYVPTGGVATFRFGPAGSVTGTVQLTGFVGACGAVGNQSTFTAELSGARASSDG